MFDIVPIYITKVKSKKCLVQCNIVTFLVFSPCMGVFRRCKINNALLQEVCIGVLRVCDVFYIWVKGWLYRCPGRPAHARCCSARRFAASSIEASHLVHSRLGGAFIIFYSITFQCISFIC